VSTFGGDQVNGDKIGGDKISHSGVGNIYRTTGGANDAALGKFLAGVADDLAQLRLSVAENERAQRFLVSIIDAQRATEPDRDRIRALAASLHGLLEGADRDPLASYLLGLWHPQP
jgi:hypothetical protein